MKRFSTVIIALVLLTFSSPVWDLMAQGSGPEPAKDRVQPNVGVLPMGPSAVTSAFSGGPAYDSGWVSLALDEAKTLTHSLGGNTDNYVVDMQYRSSDVDGVNQRYYGGMDFGATPTSGHAADDRVGAYWRSLTTTSITVYRRPQDTYAEQVRIRIWIDTAPAYNSGWTVVNQDQFIVLTHNLGGNADDYVVDMQFKSSGVDGVNQRYYGGADFGVNPAPDHNANDRVGAYWRSLSNTTLTVYRRPEDTYAPEVRVRIWIRPTATYDSGWLAISQDQSRTLTHSIGGSTDDYVVDMQFKSAANGVNQRHYGGADFGTLPPSGMNADDRVGAYWRTLTSSSIVVYRRPQDAYSEQIRIRIFRVWRPTVPDYDSRWFSIGQNASQTLAHNLGGTADDYLVDMQYNSAGSGVNQRYYGGADFGTKTTVGNPDDRVGAYWRTLTASSVVVYRRPEDTYAEQMRVRIWKMPEPDYDSGWVAFNLDQAQTFTHTLGGSYLDYLVDMQYKSADANGVNQRYYGGMDYGANTSPANARDGAYWRSLDSTSITVYRRPDDVHAPQVRIRIWRMAISDYSSGWVALTQDVAQTLTHNLGGQADNYLVNMIFWDTTGNSANQRHYGGADFGASPPSGYYEDDRVGAYWRSLTSSSIVVYRRPEDGFADYVYLRIWVTPYRIFLPVVLRN